MGSTWWQFKYKLRRNPLPFLLLFVVLLAVILTVPMLTAGESGGEIGTEMRTETVPSTEEPIQVNATEAESESGSAVFTGLFWLLTGLAIGWWAGGMRKKQGRPAYRELKRWKRTRFVR